MSINDLEALFNFIGGLGMFLYGMNVMADGLQKSSGKKMKKLLEILTNNRLIAILVGAGVTAIIQSSSATTVMIVGFVNAGLMNLSQAVGVIMGANIGTTITSWIVSMSEWGAFFKPEYLAPLFIGIGAFTMLFTKSQKKKLVAEILIGFGLLFIGLTFMSDAIVPYRDAPIFATAFQILGRNPFLGILTGAVVTAVIQSSSASVGILQTLAMNGLVTWNSAIFITLGQNIGTCITAVISSIGANRTAKRAAFIHFLFNFIGAVIFGIVMFALFSLNKAWAYSDISSVQISIFHTIFNVMNTVVLFPFANQLVKVSELVIRDKAKISAEKTDDKITLRHLDNRILETPTFAVQNAVLEVVRMGETTYDNAKLAFEAVLENDNDKADEVYKQEEVIDEMARLISDYLVQISNLSLSEQQQKLVNHLFYTVGDIERVGDHAENLAELAKFKVENNIEFSGKASEELGGVMEFVTNSLVYAIKARSEASVDFADKSVEYEDLVDYVESELREKHIERLAKNLCKPTSGVVYLDVLSNLERISDHAENIANYVKDEV